MQNTTVECSCPAATAARGAPHAGILTIVDSAIMVLGLLVGCAVILHLWSLQRAQADKELAGCVEIIQFEMPALKTRMQNLQDLYLKTRRDHHQAVGVLDGLRYDREREEPIERYMLEAE